ncbi:unnamed protein product [Paramecium octaurelia]|uniref:Uncharacterized protein n=1 Tax=Paramecium octaurelia TaxID=43137 RepID=A0A8S1YG69_PAROT|nr:unnamed protein product [Paramecium octaurelia]
MLEQFDIDKQTFQLRDQMEIEYSEPSFSHLFLIAILIGLLGFCGLGCWMEMKKCHTINKTD